MIFFNEYFLDNHDIILVEASIEERLHRTNLTGLDPHLLAPRLLYDDKNRNIITDLYRETIAVAKEINAPILLGTPTLQANRQRLSEAGIGNNVNALATRFLKYLRAEYDDWPDNLYITGTVGCKDDKFHQEKMLTGREAIDFHAWQIEQLDREGVDLFMACAQPAIQEATGIATLMAVTSTPYVVNFEINKDGKMPDGTTLRDAIIEIDSQGLKLPVGYIITCADPSFISKSEMPEIVRERLIGIMADGAAFPSQNPAEDAKNLAEWSRHAKSFKTQCKAPIIGGGGLAPEHLRYLAAQSASHPRA